MDQKDKSLTVTDNAYGMNRKTLEHAVLLAKEISGMTVLENTAWGLKQPHHGLGKNGLLKPKDSARSMNLRQC